MCDEEVAHEGLPLCVELHEVVQILKPKGAPIIICCHCVLVGDASAPGLLDCSNNVTRLLALIVLGCRLVQVEELEVKVVVVRNDIDAEQVFVVESQIERLGELKVRVDLDLTVLSQNQRDC